MNSLLLLEKRKRKSLSDVFADRNVESKVNTEMLFLDAKTFIGWFLTQLVWANC